MEKSEIEKMRAHELYRFDDAQVVANVERANTLCAQLSAMTINDAAYRPLLEQLVPGIPPSSAINPPFHCDHGTEITIGHHTFLNYDCIMIDGGHVSIGNHCKIGPRCQFLTAHHPLDYQEREQPIETCLPVSIGDNCWLGAGVIVCPGVSIGARSVIGAGSVVTRDIPADSLAAGNPAVVKRSLKAGNKS